MTYSVIFAKGREQGTELVLRRKVERDKNEIELEIRYLQADESRRTFCIMGSREKYLANLS